MKKRANASLLERAAIMGKRLRRVKGPGEVERTFFALGLAASPDERWEINLFWLNRLPPSARKAMEAEFLEAAEVRLNV